MFCRNCGKEVSKNAKFCKNCGEELNNTESKTTIQPTNIIKKDIVICVILSIVTCGIYGIYWMVTINDNVNELSNEDGVSGGMLILLIIVTCGIYSIYWYYQMGRKLYEAGNNRNVSIPDNAVLYIVLSLLGVSIVNNCLIQSDINKLC